MDPSAPVRDLLEIKAKPKLAAALRARRKQVITRWDRAVKDLLPDADNLTMAQVRDSIPRVLDQMAIALESSDPQPSRELLETTKGHGAVRFHESYNLRELIVEYRILRRILQEEIEDAYVGTVSTVEWIALDIAIDIALQQSVLTFLDFQKQQLKSATEAEAKFLSFLAHDMRNGLNTIMLTMQWVEGSLASYPALQEERDGLLNAREAARSTIDGMERLLQAERLRKGVQVKRELVLLANLAERILSEFRLSAEKKGLTLGHKIPNNATITSDSGLITLILQNLLGNAIKYSQRGDISLLATYQDVDGVQAWRMIVQDQGPGIAPDQLTQLFNAFTRGETHGQPGVGLGLFIASQAARFLNSHLEVESVLGEGARFSFLLRNLPQLPES
jgi:signal transduction histidine kinase